MAVCMSSEIGGGNNSAEQTLIIHNRLSEIATITDALEAFAAANRISETITWRFQLALEELIRNVIAHGYTDDGAHEIEVSFLCQSETLTAVVRDDGIPFNPVHIDAPDLSEALDDREIGGLGIHLARNVVEELDYS